MGGCSAKNNKVITVKPTFTRRISITPSQFVNFPSGHFSRFYKVGKKLGGGNLIKYLGAYGEVYICYHREAGYARAVKILPKGAISECERKRFFREMSILKMMDHPNIVRLYETYSDSKRYYLVTEYPFIVL
jgi:calcium-dependent protein kinase